MSTIGMVKGFVFGRVAFAGLTGWARRVRRAEDGFRNGCGGTGGGHTEDST